MGEFKIRTGTLGDIEEMTRQRHRMFEDMGHATATGIRTHDESFGRWARREIRAKRFVCFLVENDGGQVVGGGSLWLREVQPYPGFPGGKVPYLMSMYTEPRFRGMGIGGKVVEAALAWCRRHGYSSVTLHSSKMGRPLYSKLGWKQTTEMELDL